MNLSDVQPEWMRFVIAGTCEGIIARSVEDAVFDTVGFDMTTGEECYKEEYR